MKPWQNARLTNTALRGAVLLVRFAFLLVLAKYLNPAAVGYYGIFAATVGYSLYLVGFDFYAYSTRQILTSAPTKRGAMIKAQAAFSGALYIAFLPLVLLLASNWGWPDFLLLWFVPIILTEHLNQELGRLLIALSKQVEATILLLLRQGVWAIVVVVLFVSTPSSRDLNLLMMFWFLGGNAAVLFGCWKLWKAPLGGWREPVDWKWVKSGAIVSLGLLISTLALRAIQTIDRYWLEALGGLDVVGAYVLYAGIAGALIAFLDAGVFAFTYPDLIRLRNEGAYAKARSVVRRAFAQTLLICLVFAVASWAMLPILLSWIDSEVYQTHANLYFLVLIATIIYAVGMVPHYALYAGNFDRHIIVSHIAGLCAFLAVTWLLSSSLLILAIPIGLIAAFLIISLFKSVSYFCLFAPS